MIIENWVDITKDIGIAATFGGCVLFILYKIIQWILKHVDSLLGIIQNYVEVIKLLTDELNTLRSDIKDWRAETKTAFGYIREEHSNHKDKQKETQFSIKKILTKIEG